MTITFQKVIRELHLREKEYKKTILNPAPEQDVITEKIVYEGNIILVSLTSYTRRKSNKIETTTFYVIDL